MAPMAAVRPNQLSQVSIPTLYLVWSYTLQSCLFEICLWSIEGEESLKLINGFRRLCRVTAGECIKVKGEAMSAVWSQQCYLTAVEGFVVRWTGQEGRTCWCVITLVKTATQCKPARILYVSPDAHLLPLLPSPDTALPITESLYLPTFYFAFGHPLMEGRTGIDW